MSQKKYRYINVEEALQKQFEGRYNKLESYEQGSISYELKNIQNLGFGKLTLAFIIAEVMTGDDEKRKEIIRSRYTAKEIDHYLAFANKTIADKKAHVNAARVVRASEADADPFTYGLDEDEFEENPSRLIRPAHLVVATLRSYN